VGSVARALLEPRDARVTASTGREKSHDYLRELRDSNIHHREELQGEGRPSQNDRGGGAGDSVGSRILTNGLAQTCYGRAVAACGLAGGSALPATVLPHILRSVTLIGVDSVMAPRAKREEAWRLLADRLSTAHLAKMTQVAPLSQVPELAEEILAGKIRGRVVITLE